MAIWMDEKGKGKRKKESESTPPKLSKAGDLPFPNIINKIHSLAGI